MPNENIVPAVSVEELGVDLYPIKGVSLDVARGVMMVTVDDTCIMHVQDPGTPSPRLAGPIDSRRQGLEWYSTYSGQSWSSC